MTSAAFVYADTSMVKATIKSDPAGFVTKSENFIAVNYSNASLNGETNGYHIVWSVNGVRQAVPNGTASKPGRLKRIGDQRNRRPLFAEQRGQ